MCKMHESVPGTHSKRSMLGTVMEWLWDTKMKIHSAYPQEVYNLVWDRSVSGGNQSHNYNIKPWKNGVKVSSSLLRVSWRNWSYFVLPKLYLNPWWNICCCILSSYKTENFHTNKNIRHFYNNIWSHKTWCVSYKSSYDMEKTLKSNALKLKENSLPRVMEKSENSAALRRSEPPPPSLHLSFFIHCQSCSPLSWYQDPPGCSAHIK